MRDSSHILVPTYLGGFRFYPFAFLVRLQIQYCLKELLGLLRSEIDFCVWVQSKCYRGLYFQLVVYVVDVSVVIRPTRTFE